MLSKNPEKRITIPEILDNAWLKKNRVYSSDDDQPSNVSERSVITQLFNYKSSSLLHQMAIRVLVTHIDQNQIQELSEEFKRLDWDQSGFLELNEIIGALKEGRIPHDLATAQTIINSVGFQDDSVKINYTDFICATINQKDHLSDERIEAIFKYFDVDGT